MKGFSGASVLSSLRFHFAPQSQGVKDALMVLNSPVLGFLLETNRPRMSQIAIMATFLALTTEERSRLGSLICLRLEKQSVAGRELEKVTLFGKLSRPDQYFNACYRGFIKGEEGEREPQNVVFTGSDCGQKTATFSDAMIRAMNKKLWRSP